MATKTKSLSKETLLDWYREMVLIRRFESKCHYLYFEERDPARKITGVYLHLASGNEGTHIGAVKALRSLPPRAGGHASGPHARAARGDCAGQRAAGRP